MSHNPPLENWIEDNDFRVLKENVQTTFEVIADENTDTDAMTRVIMTFIRQDLEQKELFK